MTQRLRYSAFPDRFAILPSDIYRFGPDQPDGRKFEIIERQRLPNGIDVLAINAGLLAFDFAANSELGGLSSVRDADWPNGEIPQEAIQNREMILAAQVERVRHATFVTACILGVHAHETHSSVTEAALPGLHEVYGFAVLPNGQFVVPSQETAALAKRLQHRTGRRRHIPAEHVALGLSLAGRLIEARSTFHVADPLTLMVMSYQGMLLHNRQHAGASIALLGLVAESALDEIIHAYGFVGGVTPRFPAPEGVTHLTSGEVRKLGFNGRLKLVTAAGLLSTYHASLTDELRLARNALMHEAKDVAPYHSGPALNVVRELLRLCTGETGFELNMSWSYRY